MRTAWRFFPLAITAAIGLVVVVNGAMVYAALRSSPGQAGEGFALSNHYDAILADAARDAALGWEVAARTDGDGRAVVALTGRDGAPLAGASLAGIARRPLGPPDARNLVFQEAGAGRFVADVVLPSAGQWELTLTATADGHATAVTRRVIVH
ncbi:MAG: FixH family protein [Acetobacteraceae bacterium]